VKFYFIPKRFKGRYAADMNIVHTPTIWNFSLDSWIIQDGNYTDFVTGQTAEFAVEFWLDETEAPLLSDSKSLSVKSVGGCNYEVISRITFSSPEITVLDCGLLVFSENLPHELARLSKGKIRARLGLGIDPFFYFESLNQVSGVPPLIYSWCIKSILIETAPFIETVGGIGHLAGRKVMIRDPSKLGWKEIDKTDAANDDDGHASYLLQCELLPIPPKRTSSTAT